MSPEIAKPSNDGPKPTCRIIMPKDKMKDLTVDKPVTLTVSGTIKSLQPMYSDEDMYEVELQDYTTEKMDTSASAAPDDSKKKLSDMSLGELKNMISKPSDSKSKDDEGK